MPGRFYSNFDLCLKIILSGDGTDCQNITEMLDSRCDCNRNNVDYRLEIPFGKGEVGKGKPGGLSDGGKIDDTENKRSDISCNNAAENGVSI